MKILITGGAGYIGSVLTEFLLHKNYEVVVVDNLIYGASSLNHLFHFKNFNLIKCDYRDFKHYKDELIRSDCIIPLAALVGAPICSQNIIDSQLINQTYILRLFNLISKNQIIIMPTTNSGYGSGKKNQIFKEDSPLKPISSYAKQKEIVESKLMKRKNSISLRLATVFGSSSRMRLDLLVNDFTYKAVKDNSIVLFEKNFKRNFIHIRDVARAFLHCLENFDNMKGNIYNIGISNCNITKLELCMYIKKYVKEFDILFKDSKKDLDKRNYIVSNEKIESTGFKTKYSLDDGIIELIKLYKTLKNFHFGNI